MDNKTKGGRCGAKDVDAKTSTCGMCGHYENRTPVENNKQDGVGQGSARSTYYVREKR